MAGTLTLVGTPIGNLSDMSPRAVEALRSCDFIAAEDTRVSLTLLNHFGIKKPLVSYFEHNKREKGNCLIKELLDGKNIALVSDAGSPAISDPGEDLVREAIENGIEVTSIPGPAAVINALIISGLPTRRFAFEGFLPMNKRARKERLLEIKNEQRTLIFYEAPHKLTHTLKDMLEFLGDRKISLAREMTKKYEEVIRTTIKKAIEKYEMDPPKGEFVLIIEGNKEIQQFEKNWDDISIPEHIESYIKQGVDKKEALKLVAKDRNISKREVYNFEVKNRK
jgi:16S rRNA (cytidine1402-2'-O)-methyltransferase